MKKCNRCRIVKPLDDFYEHKKARDGRFNFCKLCHGIGTRKWRAEHPEKTKKYARKHFIRNRYGLEPLWHLSLLREHDFKCAICGATQSDASKAELSIDHDHETGKIRGVLCGNCNNGLGRFKDDIDLLRKAVSYLEKYDGKEIVSHQIGEASEDEVCHGRVEGRNPPQWFEEGSDCP